MVKHGGKITYGSKNKTVDDINNEIVPTLEGNVEAKIDDYVVKVITVTPEDFNKTSNLNLIDRANLIVLSQPDVTQSENAGLVGLFKNYRNEELFSQPSYTSTTKSFTDSGNDLPWAAVERILSKVAGVSTVAGKKITLPLYMAPFI